ncbi:hypothetical protein C1645_829778 [Glomus cerebriforme]|uniref:Uncharacterized protein n=1 Tax=Glomus cerebriforme TaxID=658196 RepID=A0A397SMI4_9GLOM|nr:hypothetical protein C1645_829778 [Glomus cerebriforme]
MNDFVNKEDIIYEKDFNKELDYKPEEDVVYLTKHLTVKKIIHLLIPMKYPPMSEEGVAIIFHIEEWRIKKQHLQMYVNIHVC